MNINLDDAVVVALGSNLPGVFGSSRALLQNALARLPDAGVNVLRASPLWRSASWPDPNEPDYLNAVVLVETDMAPQALMAALHALERDFGRCRESPNSPRTLDLDLSAHGRTVIDAGELVLPYPRAAARRFVMGPLAQIAPAWVHPVTGLTAAELFETADVGMDAAPV